MEGLSADARRSDADGAAAIAGRGIAATAAAVGEVHTAISGRVFSLADSRAVPVQVVVDGISKGVYIAVGGGARAASYAAGLVLGEIATRRTRAADYRRLADR